MDEMGRHFMISNIIVYTNEATRFLDDAGIGTSGTKYDALVLGGGLPSSITHEMRSNVENTLAQECTDQTTTLLRSLVDNRFGKGYSDKILTGIKSSDEYKALHKPVYSTKDERYIATLTAAVNILEDAKKAKKIVKQLLQNKTSEADDMVCFAFDLAALVGKLSNNAHVMALNDTYSMVSSNDGHAKGLGKKGSLSPLKETLRTIESYDALVKLMTVDDDDFGCSCSECLDDFNESDPPKKCILASVGPNSGNDDRRALKYRVRTSGEDKSILLETLKKDRKEYFSMPEL